MGRKYAITVCLFISLGLLQPWLADKAFAADGPGSTGAGYLILPVGPKSIAMGEVKAALVDDSFNWLSNPGALQYMNGTGVGVLHSEWLVDTRYNNVAAHHRFSDKFILSGAFTYEYYPEIQGYDEFGMPTKTLTNNNYQAFLGFGFSPSQSFTAGINVKYFREKLDEWSAGGMAVDIGALYTITPGNISLGFAVQNLGPDIKFNELSEPLPTLIRVGGGQVISITEGIFDLAYAVDLVKPKYESIYLSLGAELQFYETLQVRAGYCGQEYRQGDGLTLGGGVRIQERLQVDYAWTPYGDLGNYHRIAVYFTAN
jgi:hypothetical protein